MINIAAQDYLKEVREITGGRGVDPSPTQAHAGMLLAKNLNLRAHRYMESNAQIGKIVVTV